jgi:hypothetical protein
LLERPDMPRIIVAIIAVHMSAAKMKPTPVTPVATSTIATTRRILRPGLLWGDV